MFKNNRKKKTLSSEWKWQKVPKKSPEFHITMQITSKQLACFNACQEIDV
jgi:hypothetical protein